MPSLLQQAGALVNPSRFAPIHVNRMVTGLWTQRNPLREAAVPYLYEKFYSGARNDSLIDGLNAEISPRLTLRRRPGHSVYNSQIFPAINRFYSFRTFSTLTERIYVMADTADTVYDATGPNTKNAVFVKSPGAGSTYFQSVGNVLFMGNGRDQTKWRPGNAAENWGVAAPARAPSLSPDTTMGAPCRFWVPKTEYAAGYTVLDDNGNIQLLTGNQNAAQTTTQTLRPANYSNGVFPPNFPIIPVGGVTIDPFINQGDAVDDDPNTAAYYVRQHSRHYAIAVWKFAASALAAVALQLNFLTSALAPISTGTGMSGIYYSLDGMTTWQSLRTGISWAKIADQLSILAATVVGNIHIAAYIESHDDGGCQAYDLSLSVVTNTVTPPTPGVYKTGDRVPNWNTTLFGLTADGTAIWQNCGPISQWQAATAYSTASASIAILDPYGNLRVVTTPGVTGATEPTWSTAPNAGDTLVDGTVTWTNYGPGATVAVKGYTYGYAYHCLDGHCSTLSPLSQSTGPILGNMQVPISGDRSGDAQVDAVWVFRTLDGDAAAAIDGGSTMLFDFATPNAAWGSLDINGDLDLNELVQGPMAHQNDPPPVGLGYMEYHMGRVWGAVGNTVYYTRTQNALAGDPLQSFPPANYFVFPAAVRRLWSCTLGLLVFTTSDVYIIVGRGASFDPFWSPGRYIKGHGLLHYDAFTVNGSTPHLLTTARKLVAFEPGAGLTEAGFPIGDQFERLTTGGFDAEVFDPALAFITWHERTSGETGLFAADGARGYFRMAPASAPETGMIWSPFAALAAGTSAVQSVETSPGLRDLLIGPRGTPGVGSVGVEFVNSQSFTVTFGVGEQTKTISYASGAGHLLMLCSFNDSAGAYDVSAVTDGINPAWAALHPEYGEPGTFYRAGAAAITTITLRLNAVPSQVVVAKVMVGEWSGFTSVLGAGRGAANYAQRLDGTGATHAIMGFGYFYDHPGFWDDPTIFDLYHSDPASHPAAFVAPDAGTLRNTVTGSRFSDGQVAGIQLIDDLSGVGHISLVLTVPAYYVQLPFLIDSAVAPTGNGPILKRDTAVNTDNGAAFAAYATIGNLVLSQPGQTAELGFVTADSRRRGTRTAVSILLGEISGAFEKLVRNRQDPPLLPPSKTLFNDRFYFSQNMNPTYCRHLQLRIDWKAEDAANELLAYTLFGAIHNERHR